MQNEFDRTDKLYFKVNIKGSGIQIFKYFQFFCIYNEIIQNFIWKKMIFHL